MDKRRLLLRIWSSMIFTVVVGVWSVMMLRASGITLRLDGGFLFAVVLLFCLIVLACLILLRETEKSEYREYLLKEMDENKSVESLKNERKDIGLYEEIRIKTGMKRDIIALMLKNNDEVTEYFTISKTQAKLAFYFSVIACISGIVMLAFAIYGGIVMENMVLSYVC